MLIYESPTGTLLQTGPATTVRVTGDEVLVRRAGNASIMPAGMLDDLEDGELADLYAYLKTLTAVIRER